MKNVTGNRPEVTLTERGHFATSYTQRLRVKFVIWNEKIVA